MYKEPPKTYNPYDFTENSIDDRSKYNLQDSIGSQKGIDQHSGSSFQTLPTRMNTGNSTTMQDYNIHFNNQSYNMLRSSPNMNNIPTIFYRPEIFPYLSPNSIRKFISPPTAPYLPNLSNYNKHLPFSSPLMGNPIVQLNNLLSNPTKENILSIFHSDGYLRLNMLYISPISISHFRTKLLELGLVNWTFTDNELIFKLKTQIISFRGALKITYRDSKIFCLELDFDPIISDNGAMKFLKEVEAFLKNCDAVFFMTCAVSIDSEILNYPLSESLGFLASRK